MILVNSAGYLNAVYPWIEHSSWHGCTLADCIFPFFLFIMGISLVFSIEKQQRMAQHTNIKLNLFFKIFRRSLIIFLLGFSLNLFGSGFNFSTVRVMGVLQHIAVCYLIAATLYLYCSIRIQAIVMLVLLIAYALMITLIPVPGIGANVLTQEGNLPAYVDRLIFSQKHIFLQGSYDPEGLLTVLPAVASVLVGNLTGVWLLSRHSSKQTCLAMLAAGMLSLLLAHVCQHWLPLNKALWTSSFVLYTSGWALILFTLFYWVIDVKGWKAWSKPLEIFGLNAILVYFLHIFFLIVQRIITVHEASGKLVVLRVYFTDRLYGWAQPATASLLYAITYLLFWFLILAILYRRRIFL